MAKRTADDLREAAIVKSLSKRSKVALCVHGINKSYCVTCESKRAKASAGKGKKKAPEAEAAPEAPEQTA